MKTERCKTCWGTGKIVEQVRLCNKCGNTCNRGADDWVDDYGIEVTYTGGYFSTELEDNTVYHFRLCEPCLAELFKTFVIPPDNLENTNECE